MLVKYMPVQKLLKQSKSAKFRVIKLFEGYFVPPLLGFEYDVFYGNTIFYFDGNCGGSRNAKRMFDEIPEKDLMSWNTLMKMFFVNRCWAKVFDLFEEMRLRSGFKPNIVNIVSVLPMCADVENEGIVGWTWSFWLNRNQDSS